MYRKNTLKKTKKPRKIKYTLENSGKYKGQSQNFTL